MTIWEPRAIAEGANLHWRVGPLDLWVRLVGDEWHAGIARSAEDRPAEADTGDAPAEIAWWRWAAPAPGARVQLAPAMPDRPVIVRPAMPLRIAPGQEARFFVGVPLWIRLLLLPAGGAPIVMLDAYSTQLSKSWFGTPIEGELCYALRTRARRRLDEIEPAPHRVVCPLRMRNRSPDMLTFERLCLRVPHLAVYAGQSHLWAGESDIAFQGAVHPSQIVYGATPPPFDGAAARMAEPREVPRHGLADRVFGNWKAWTTV